MGEPKHVVIIGSGVIGLTVAHVLSSRHPCSKLSITIIARDTPDTGMNSTGWASPWAGANWFPFLDKDPENKWERISLRKFTDGDVPKDLVLDLPTKYYAPDADRLKMIWYRDIVKEFKTLSPPFPESIVGTPPAPSGFELTTISVNVPRYLSWLQDELRSRGVHFVHGWVSSIEDVEYVPELGRKQRTDVIVNASGLGAKSIIGIADPLVFPIRGQTVLVRAPEIKWSLMGMGLLVDNDTDETIYIIPRISGDVIIGGTFQENNWDVSPDPKTARSILERALCYCPELSTASPPNIDTIQVLRHNVALRPARKGGARVEKEVVALPLRHRESPQPQTEAGPSWRGLETIGNGMVGPESLEALGKQFEIDTAPRRTVNVVHAYGIGPAGYQASWGMGEDVADLVEEFLSN